MMHFETRVRIHNQTGRIKVLAANPRTARGFSGDLILDEFAFHENAAAIWEAAEPILASNKDYLCRIASTPNGKHNMFYRLCTSMGALGSPASPVRTCNSASSDLRSPDETKNNQSPISNYELPISPSALSVSSVNSMLIRKSPANPPLSSAPNPPSPIPTPQSLFAGIDLARKQDETTPPPPTPPIPVSRITRTDAYLQGCPVFHPITRQPITPPQARPPAPRAPLPPKPAPSPKTNAPTTKTTSANSKTKTWPSSPTNSSPPPNAR